LSLYLCPLPYNIRKKDELSSTITRYEQQKLKKILVKKFEGDDSLKIL
jgi:hypothetical protein